MNFGRLVEIPIGPRGVVTQAPVAPAHAPWRPGPAGRKALLAVTSDGGTARLPRFAHRPLAAAFLPTMLNRIWVAFIVAGFGAALAQGAAGRLDIFSRVLSGLSIRPRPASTFRSDSSAS